MTHPLPVTEPSAEVPPLPPEPNPVGSTVAALVVALVGVAGTLYLSMALGYKACPLCYYQRSFIFASAAVLLVGLLIEGHRLASACLFALPMATAGLGVAGYHVYLEVAGKLVCPQGAFGIGTAPQQSLTVHALLFVLLLIGGLRRPVMAVAVVLGALLALGSVLSVSPLPLPPPRPDGVIEICRPPSTLN